MGTCINVRSVFVHHRHPAPDCSSGLVNSTPTALGLERDFLGLTYASPALERVCSPLERREAGIDLFLQCGRIDAAIYATR